MHSLYSDGSETIDSIFSTAKELGLTALAVTDHDTVFGIASEDEASGRFHIPYVPIRLFSGCASINSSLSFLSSFLIAASRLMASSFVSNTS